MITYVEQNNIRYDHNEVKKILSPKYSWGLNPGKEKRDENQQNGPEERPISARSFPHPRLVQEHAGAQHIRQCHIKRAIHGCEELERDNNNERFEKRPLKANVRCHVETDPPCQGQQQLNQMAC